MGRLAGLDSTRRGCGTAQRAVSFGKAQQTGRHLHNQLPCVAAGRSDGKRARALLHGAARETSARSDAAVAAWQALSALTVLLAVAYGTHRYAPAAARKVYLLDTFTYKPPDRRARRVFACPVAVEQPVCTGLNVCVVLFKGGDTAA